MPKATKRILSVTVKRIVDTDADTSNLGEYSNTPETEYAIDRRHSEDCILNDIPQKTKLERIANYIEDFRPTCEQHIYESYPNCETCQEELAHTQALDQIHELIECDCRRGHYDSREYRYFNGNIENYKGESTEDIRKYVRQDYERMESLQRGDWYYIGIRAEAEIAIPSSRFADSDNVQTITSGGLWGTESDSDESYLESIEQDELSDLKTQLLALGFSKRAIATAFKNIGHKND